LRDLYLVLVCTGKTNPVCYALSHDKLTTPTFFNGASMLLAIILGGSGGLGAVLAAGVASRGAASIFFI